MHHCGLLTHLWMEDRLHDEHRRRHVAAALSTHSHSVSHYSQTALLLHYQNTVLLQTSFYFNSSTSFSSVITAVLYILAGYITWSLIHFRRCSTRSCQCHVTRLAGDSLAPDEWFIAYTRLPTPNSTSFPSCFCSLRWILAKAKWCSIIQPPSRAQGHGRIPSHPFLLR